MRVVREVVEPPVGSPACALAAFAAEPLFAWRPFFFTVENLSMMALRATAEGGAPKARH